jgi:hypothetical protein
MKEQSEKKIVPRKEDLGLDDQNCQQKNEGLSPIQRAIQARRAF